MFKSSRYPGQCVATRRGSPLLVGIKSIGHFESDHVPVIFSTKGKFVHFLCCWSLLFDVRARCVCHLSLVITMMLMMIGKCVCVCVCCPHSTMDKLVEEDLHKLSSSQHDLEILFYLLNTLFSCLCCIHWHPFTIKTNYLIYHAQSQPVWLSSWTKKADVHFLLDIAV